MRETVQIRSPIDERDFRILMFLETHPLTSKVSIAENLGCKSETVAAHIQSMKERGLYAGAFALLSYPRLELKRVLVAVSASLKNLLAISAACRAHPYVRHVASVQGGIDGVFVTVMAPIGSMHLLVEFFDQLATQGTIDDYRMYLADDSGLEFLTPNLRALDPVMGVWNFDWEMWEATDSVTQSIYEKQRRLLEPGLHLLAQTDLELLRLISQDKIASGDTTRLARSPPHTLRRRIRFLADQGFIVGYRAAIAYRHLALSNNVLFYCKSRPSVVQKCETKILELPFPGTFIPMQAGFLLQTTLPPEGPRSMFRFLSELCEHVDLSWCVSEYDAPLNSAAYVTGSWRVDRLYLLEEPLRAAT